MLRLQPELLCDHVIGNASFPFATRANEPELDRFRRKPIENLMGEVWVLWSYHLPHDEVGNKGVEPRPPVAKCPKGLPFPASRKLAARSIFRQSSRQFQHQEKESEVETAGLEHCCSRNKCS